MARRPVDPAAWRNRLAARRDGEEWTEKRFHDRPWNETIGGRVQSEAGPGRNPRRRIANIREAKPPDPHAPREEQAMRITTRRIALATTSLAAILATSLLGGCLVTSSNQVQQRGTRVSQATLGQVQPGETTEGWLIATLGEPQERTPIEGQPGVEILKYVYSIHDSGGGTIFLVFAGSHNRVERSTTYFEVRDGVVTRHWTEG
jgi:hypothetical protein